MSGSMGVLVPALLLLLSGCGPRLTVGTTTVSWHSIGETHDLEELLRGNPRAEREAWISRAYFWCGSGSTIAGSGLTLVGGLAVVPGDPHGQATRAAGAVLLGQGLATLVTAAVCFSQAKVHAVRAATTGGGQVSR
jgi:hypothetical protein